MILYDMMQAVAFSIMLPLTSINCSLLCSSATSMIGAVRTGCRASDSVDRRGRVGLQDSYEDVIGMSRVAQG
jgi:hypothetical protein